MKESKVYLKHVILDRDYDMMQDRVRYYLTDGNRVDAIITDEAKEKWRTPANRLWLLMSLFNHRANPWYKMQSDKDYIIKYGE